ncbi:hypothetical protein [Methanosarcina mazei]|uniref:hypothetical protein n=1 Tax=Methanosarcina mazei TaxID=2209 RepID=UPI00064F225F|nr:hypothetical protein [Methanosarcina mazei]
MLPYEKEKIQSFLDVRDIYSKNFKMDDLKDIRVQKFIKEELKELIQKDLDQYEWDIEIGLRRKKPSPAQLKQKHIGTAYARGLYRFYWCHYNVWDQLFKYRYKPEDVNTIIARMEKTKKYNPWSTTEPTAGLFIASLGKSRFKTIKTKDGSEYDVLNPSGY